MPEPRRQTVSLCMIVRNEERNLGDCLETIASLFDEIIIVDTGSHDATKQIARRFTEHVFDFAWCDDFSAARNESLRRSTGDWIFWLDADDRLSSENVARLRDLFDGLSDRPRLYYMETVLHGPAGSQDVLLSHLRLFRRHPELRWQNRVHEHLQPDPTPWGYTSIRSDIRIDHLGYQDAALRHRKLRRDIRLLRMDYAVDPDNCSTVLHLGLAYAELGNHAAARQQLHRVLASDGGEWIAMERIYRVLADLSLREGQLAEALRTLDCGLARFPQHSALLYSQACIFMEMSRYDDACRSLEQIIASPETREHYAVPCDLERKLAPCRLAEVLRLQKEFGRAEQTLRAVLQHFSEDAPTWYALGCLYGDTGQRDALMEVIDRLHSCPRGEVLAAVLQAAWHLKQQELEAAGVLIDRLISEAPQLPLPRLLRCQWLDQKRAALEARIQSRRDVLRLQPGNPEITSSLESLLDIQRLSQRTTTFDWFGPIFVSSIAAGEGVVA